MIDPITTLAFSMQSSPGTFALLLGSGISRPASIPTGWDITLDLVKKLAATSGEECTPSPEEWYREKFGKEPGYSELLDNLVKAQTERQMLLREYFEPTLEEKSEGVKKPTIAHRSIATLVMQGFIRVIITTNFDHLLETALREVGIEPTVISTPDQIKGALPLIHTRCCLLKVNGDYLDTRIRNTEEELATYEPEFDSLLDQIFDEFGLVVCGWSAQWDGALRKAIERTPTRRFSSYWVTRGELGSSAQDLISRRRAQIVKSKDADSFFSALREQVESLVEYSRPHPLSTEAALASLKRYLGKSEFRIRFSDLVNSEVDKVLEATTGPSFAFSGIPEPDKRSITARFRKYDAACQTLLPMSVIGGYWAEQQHLPVWQQALSRLSIRRDMDQRGWEVLIQLQRYMGCLFFYGFGMGALATGKIEILGKLFSKGLRYQKTDEKLETVKILNAWQITCDMRWNRKQLHEDFEKSSVPISNLLHRNLKKHFQSLVEDERGYDNLFDKFEIIVGLSGVKHESGKNDISWAPIGLFVFQEARFEKILEEIYDSISSDGDSSPLVISRLFGGSAKECTESILKFKAFVSRVRGSFW